MVGEIDAVGDVVAVEVFAFQGPEPAFARCCWPPPLPPAPLRPREARTPGIQERLLPVVHRLLGHTRAAGGHRHLPRSTDNTA